MPSKRLANYDIAQESDRIAGSDTVGLRLSAVKPPSADGTGFAQPQSQVASLTWGSACRIKFKVQGAKYLGRLQGGLRELVSVERRRTLLVLRRGFHLSGRGECERCSSLISVFFTVDGSSISVLPTTSILRASFFPVLECVEGDCSK